MTEATSRSSPRPRRASTACSPRATWSTTSTARPSRRRAWAARRPWTRNATSRPWATSRFAGRLRPKSPRRRPDRRPPPLRVVRPPERGRAPLATLGTWAGPDRCRAGAPRLRSRRPGLRRGTSAKRCPLPRLVPAGDRGGFTFPVARSNWLSVVEFGDDWHDPRFRLVDGRWLLGGYHEGNDILAEEGTPVLAATSGTVEAVDGRSTRGRESASGARRQVLLLRAHVQGRSEHRGGERRRRGRGAGARGNSATGRRGRRTSSSPTCTSASRAPPGGRTRSRWSERGCTAGRWR